MSLSSLTCGCRSWSFSALLILTLQALGAESRTITVERASKIQVRKPGKDAQQRAVHNRQATIVVQTDPHFDIRLIRVVVGFLSMKIDNV